MCFYCSRTGGRVEVLTVKRARNGTDYVCNESLVAFNRYLVRCGNCGFKIVATKSDDTARHCLYSARVIACLSEVVLAVKRCQSLAAIGNHEKPFARRDKIGVSPNLNFGNILCWANAGEKSARG